MSKLDFPTLNQTDLAAEWQKTLSGYLNEADQAKVTQNVKNPQGLLIHITTAGRSFYTLEFDVAYLDSREVKVEFVLASQENKPVDEHTERLQELIQDYVRHIHECAQDLQRITHS